MERQTEFGQSLDLKIYTQVMKIGGTEALFIRFTSGTKLIRKSFIGFGLQQFKRIDEQVRIIAAHTGAEIVHHQSDDCDRRHSGRMCNTNDAGLHPRDKELR